MQPPAWTLLLNLLAFSEALPITLLTQLAYALMLHSFPFSRRFCQWYLALVPFVVAALGFGVGHLRYQVYVPLWAINAGLMLLAARHLSAPDGRAKDAAAALVVRSAWLLVLPWVLFSIFFGMGPPPATAAGWAAAVTEQQVRYAILVVGGICAAVGLVLLSDRLHHAGEPFYSRLSCVAILLAVSLFIFNMTYWGSFLGEAFRQFAIGPAQRPDWYAPIRAQLAAISLVEVALTYLATAALAYSLKQLGWLAPKAGAAYVLASLVAFGLDLVPSAAPEPFATQGLSLLSQLFLFCFRTCWACSYYATQAASQRQPRAGSAARLFGNL